jgi:phage/plasmid-like protein (TIGR03299 family)
MSDAAKTPTNFIEALSEFGLNWQVEPRPLFTLGNDGQPLAVEGSSAIVRADNGLPLSVVGSRYVPVQNAACADIMDGVLARAGGSYVKGGMFGLGKKVYVQAQLPDTVKVKGTDESQKLLTFITSHDMTTQVLLGFTAVRIICMNTFMMAVQDAQRQVVIRHTRNAESRLETVQAILEGQLHYFRQLEVKANWLADQKFTDLQMDLAMRTVLGVRDGLQAQDIPTRTKNVMDIVRGNFEGGLGIDSSNRGSAWAAYNAFSEYTNHQRAVRNADDRGGEASVRVESILMGTGAAMNDRALLAIETLLT